MESLLTLSGKRLAEMIRKREVTSTEVVETHIRYAQKVNPTLNAIVQDRFDLARKEARQADEKVKTIPPEKLPPLHGVPCTIKECFALSGMSNTSGLVARKGVTAKDNAVAVSRLLSAGVIPLGVTNVPELCMWMETYNKIYGRTNNPYNPGHIVGGSSGGEGAIIGSGASPFGLGSDIGGSIRMPAFFNGIFGHKPTSLTVPNTGQYPVVHGDSLRYLTTGPLCRRAEDLPALLEILAGPDREHPDLRTFKQENVSSVKLAGLPVISVEDNGATPVSDDLRAAQKKCAEALAARGAQVKYVRIEGLKKSLEIWSAMLTAAGGTPYSVLLGNGKPISTGFEFLRAALGISPYTLPSIVLAFLEKFPKYTPGRTKKMVEAGLALRQELVEKIGTQGVMLYPSYSRPAPRHQRPLLRPFDWVYTAVMNVMELPITQVPLGLNAEGLPLGIQVIGIHGNDHVTIAVALELEKIFGGWVPPPMLAENLK